MAEASFITEVSLLSELAQSLLRRRLAGERVDVTDENRPHYRELVDAVRAVAAGEIYVRPQVARFLAASIRGQAATAHAEDRLGKLSGRERTVVELMAEGFNGPEIGDRLGISAKTVETYKQRIGEKLGIEHRSEYVRLALEEGLLHR